MKLALVIVGIASVGAASFVYGFIVGQTIPVTVTLASGSPFAFYFDTAKTQAVSSIAFGSVARGQKLWVGLCIFLVSQPGSAIFYWNSTLKTQTTKITDGWVFSNNVFNTCAGTGPGPAPINGTTITSSGIATSYFINIAADAAVQPYSYVLNIGSSP